MIHPWTSLGEPSVLTQKYGKKMVSQMFLNPKTNQQDEYILYGERNYSQVVALTENQQIIVVRQYRHGCNQVAIELPAGCADVAGETAIDLIKRELLEETGYEANQLIGLGKPLFISTSNSWTKCYPFLATGCHKVQGQNLDQTEEIEVELMSLEQWVKLCDSEVVEIGSVAITLRALRYLGQL